MSPEERQLITGLFDRIRTAAATPRDREAEALVDQATRDQPYAAYYLAQAVIVQEKGLEAAAGRIRELEDRIHALEAGDIGHQNTPQPGGFLSSIFGSREPQAPAQTPASSGPWSNASRQNYQASRGYDDGYRAPQAQSPVGGPWGAPSYAPPSAGGGFLRGALGTAAGVAGGMLLANSLSGIFGNHMNSLGLGSPGESLFGGGAANAPVEETVINNYYGDDGARQASDNSNLDNDNSGGGNDGGWQQADFGGNDDQSDFGGGDDNTLDV